MISKLRVFKFPLFKQYEFLSNFISLKTNSEGEEVIATRQAIESMREIYTESVGSDSIECEVCDSILDNFQAGCTFAEAMEEWFHPDICLVYRVSREAGSQRSGAEAIIKIMQDQHALKWRIILTLLVPMLIMTLGLAAFLGAAIFVLPMLVTSPDDLKKVTGLAGAMLSVGNFIKVIWPILVILPVSLVSVMIYLIPIKGLTATYRNFSAGRFFSLLSILVNSQLSLKQSLMILHPHVSPFLQDHIEEMLSMTKEGDTEFTQLDTGLLPLYLRVRMKVRGRNSSTSMGVFTVISESAGSDFKAAIMAGLSFTKWAMIAIGFVFIITAYVSLFSMQNNLSSM